MTIPTETLQENPKQHFSQLGVTQEEVSGERMRVRLIEAVKDRTVPKVPHSPQTRVAFGRLTKEVVEKVPGVEVAQHGCRT